MMNKDNAGLKILLITVCVLLVIAIALVLMVFLGDRTPIYETIGMQYEAPIEVYSTPEPTPEPSPEAQELPEGEVTPEPTPEPTPDEDGFWPCEDSVTVDADTLNVRSGPGTDFEALGSVADGTRLDRTGYSDEGWTRVIYNGETAYVSSDYVVAESAE